MNNELYTRVADLIVEKFDAPAAAITPDTRFEELDFDSLVLVEFTLALQRTFGVELAEGELQAEQTIGAVAAILASKGVVVGQASGSTAG